jgi:RNA polymerase sigma factor (sigma-70 family)
MNAPQPRADPSFDELWRRCAAMPPDQQAWTDLYRRFSHLVASWIIELAGGATQAEVEELVQETFLKAFRSIRNFDPALSSLTTYLRIIATRTAVDGWRRTKREKAVAVSFEDEIQALVLASYPSPADPSVLERALRSRLSRVQPPQRLQVFEMFLDGKDADWIATQVGLSAATVYRMRQDCREWVREALTQIQAR